MTEASSEFLLFQHDEIHARALAPAIMALLRSTKVGL